MIKNDDIKKIEKINYEQIFNILSQPITLFEKPIKYGKAQFNYNPGIKQYSVGEGIGYEDFMWRYKWFNDVNHAIDYYNNYLE